MCQPAGGALELDFQHGLTVFVQGEQLAAGPRRHLVATHGTHAAHVLAKLRKHAPLTEVAPEEGGVAALLEIGGAKEVQPVCARAHTHTDTHRVSLIVLLAVRAASLQH